MADKSTEEQISESKEADAFSVADKSTEEQISESQEVDAFSVADKSTEEQISESKEADAFSVADKSTEEQTSESEEVLSLLDIDEDEILDEEEFEGDTRSEEAVSPAEELGLQEVNKDAQFFIFQLPTVLPLSNTENAEMATNLKDLAAGRLGIMRVYSSGKMKMKIGDTLFDVWPGIKSSFAQDAAFMSIEEKKCCAVGNISGRVMVTPDVDALLSK